MPVTAAKPVKAELVDKDDFDITALGVELLNAGIIGRFAPDKSGNPRGAPRAVVFGFHPVNILFATAMCFSAGTNRTPVFIQCAETAIHVFEDP
jgi:hypothetical protein